MIYGYAWDTSSAAAFAWSILPILGIGLIVTLEATAAGFAIAMVLGLVLGESLLLCLIAAAIGLALSFAALPIIKMGLQGVELSPNALIPGVGAAVLLALIVGMPPALRAMRLNIVDALADKR